MDEIKWGVIGAGLIANKFCADLQHADRARLAAVASRDRSRAEAFAGRHPGARPLDSYEALVADPDIDAIYIATPNSLHKAHSLLALGAGKPVLCEKPFALSAAEAQEIVTAARAAGVFCMEAMWTRYLPAMAAIRAQVRDGAIGAVTMVRAEIGFAVDAATPGRFNDPGLGAGALLDLGVYGVSMAHWFLGAPIDGPSGVTAVGRFTDSGVDRDMVATLQHVSGVSVVIASHAAELSNTLEVIGERGRITVDAPFLQAVSAQRVAYAPAAPQPYQPEGALKTALKKSGAWPAARATAKWALGRGPARISKPFPGDGYQFEADEVGRQLRAGALESPEMSLDDSLAVMTTLDRISAAARG